MSQILKTYQVSPDTRFELCQGDITLEDVDAVVNAANAQLRHGGGVAAAIARRAGPLLDEESRQWVRQHGPVTHTTPAITTAGSMPARHVIHAVGPIWGDGNEERKLADTITSTLALAAQQNLISIAFPAISTGIYGFPKELAAPIFFNSIQAFFRSAKEPVSLKEVKIVLYDQPTLDVFLTAFDQWTTAS